jgi:hypothetical protein
MIPIVEKNTLRYMCVVCPLRLQRRRSPEKNCYPYNSIPLLLIFYIVAVVVKVLFQKILDIISPSNWKSPIDLWILYKSL